MMSPFYETVTVWADITLLSKLLISCHIHWLIISPTTCLIIPVGVLPCTYLLRYHKVMFKTLRTFMRCRRIYIASPMCHYPLTLVLNLFLITSIKCATILVHIRKRFSNTTAAICEWLLMITHLSKQVLIGPTIMHILLYPRWDPSPPYRPLGYVPRSIGLMRKCGADRKTQ